MCESESFYEPTDHWSDCVGSYYDDSSKMSIDERMESEAVSLEDLEESWQAYMEEIDTENQTPSRRRRTTVRPTDPLGALIDYLFVTNQTHFEVRLRDGSKWRGYLTWFETRSTVPYLVTLPSLHNYDGFESFTNPCDLLNHLLEIRGDTLLSAAEDPLNFIWTYGSHQKCWETISRELRNLE